MQIKHLDKHESDLYHYLDSHSTLIQTYQVRSRCFIK